MKRGLSSLIIVVLAVGCCHYSREDISEHKLKKMPDEIVMLYPEGAPDDNGLEASTEGLQPGYTQIGNVPKMSFFFPEYSNGQMIVLTPGGGYCGIYTFGGVMAANWFNERGIAVCMLEYRLPSGEMEIPLEDVQAAFRYCRKHAASFGVNQIGICGGSAGAHLASLASSRFVDSVSRPDFAVLLYPLISVEDSNDDEILDNMFAEDRDSVYLAKYSTDRLVNGDTPPTFIACNEDDLIVPYHNSEKYRDALKKHSVPVEFHCYKSGFHGWGFNSQKYCDILNIDNQGYYGQNDTVGVHYGDLMEPWRKDFEKCLTDWLKEQRKSAPTFELPDTSVVNEYVERFNADDEELYSETYPNARAAEFLDSNIPLFQCPDKEFEKTYYFRWWVFRKHLRLTDHGYVITEFMPNVFWASKDNAINCPAAFQISEARWLKDKKIASDYLRFWVSPGAGVRDYSFPLADALYSYYKVAQDRSIVFDMYDETVRNYESWEDERRDSTGLFWQIDLRDGMECSISGKMSPDLTGYRPTINSYMYADAKALARMASMVGKVEDVKFFENKADTIKKLMDDLLWDDDFYKVIPRHSDMSCCQARELLGYIPWMYGIPDANKLVAWKQLTDPQGFQSEFGPTTAEQRAEGFAVNYPSDPYDYAAQWNGPSWPFATAQTLLALASAIRMNGECSYVNRDVYFNLFQKYSSCHRNTLDDHKKVCWIDENLNPFTGEWMLRKINMYRGNSDQSGKDYNHSGYADLLITGLMGIVPQENGSIILEPLLPEDVWDYFCLTDVVIGGRTISMVYDKTGKVYEKGKGLNVYVDGKKVFHSNHYSVHTTISM